TLASHPDIQECVVVAKTQSENKQLVAYYTTVKSNHGKGGIGADELNHYLRESLPEYMIPAFFIPLDEIPVTPNGKVDRKKLTERNITLRPSQGATTLIAQNEGEILALWREVLGVDDIQPIDGFFDAGGNSVLAAVLADKISKKFHIPFTATEVFKYPKLRDINTYLNSLNGHEGSSVSTSLNTVDKAQQKLPVSSQLGSGLSYP